jgi:hypothetical protein
VPTAGEVAELREEVAALRARARRLTGRYQDSPGSSEPPSVLPWPALAAPACGSTSTTWCIVSGCR